MYSIENHKALSNPSLHCTKPTSLIDTVHSGMRQSSSKEYVQLRDMNFDTPTETLRLQVEGKETIGSTRILRLLSNLQSRKLCVPENMRSGKRR